VLLRLVYLSVTNVFALLRLLSAGDRDKDAEILALRHQVTVLQRQLGMTRPRFSRSDRAFLAALLHRLPRDVLRRFRLLVQPETVLRWHRDLLALLFLQPGDLRIPRISRRPAARAARPGQQAGIPGPPLVHDVTGIQALPAQDRAFLTRPRRVIRGEHIQFVLRGERPPAGPLGHLRIRTLMPLGGHPSQCHGLQRDWYSWRRSG